MSTNDPTTVSPTRERLPVRAGHRAWLLGGLGLNLVTLAWVAVATFVSGRGFGVGNEALYVLSYEYWDRNRRMFTGAQYLYGPLFDLVGQDIVALRLIRLVLIVLTHVFLGVTFARWLRLHRPRVAAGRAWEYAVASLVTVSAAVLYSWLPPTPGYDDVVLLGSAILMSLLLLSLRRVETGGRVPLIAGLAAGAVAGAMALSKPPSIVAVLVILLACGYALHRAGARVWTSGVAVALGVILFAASVQVFIASWSDILPPMRAQMSVLSRHTHSPLGLAGWYAESSVTLLEASALVCLPTAIGALVARRLVTRSARVRSTAALTGLAASVALLAGVGGFRAGADNVLAFMSGIVAMVVIVLAATVARTDRRALRAGPVVVYALLAVVPVLQGLGTGNALYAAAVNGASLWVALMIAAVTRRPIRWTPGAAVPAGATLVTITLVVVLGIDGLTHDGGGRNLLAGRQAHVAGLAELSGITLRADAATRLSSLRRDLGIADRTHRPMLAFGELGHYVLFLGGRPIGASWYSQEDDGLNGADLRAACRHGNPWGADQPLVVANRAPSADELAAWRACGVDYSADYVDVTPAGAPTGVHVLRSRTATPSPSGTGRAR